MFDNYLRQHTLELRLRCLPIFILCIGLASSTYAATFTVNSTADSPDMNTGDGICDAGGGVCTLRAAMQQANALAGPDSIAFSIAGSGVHSISPLSPLPGITQQLTLDGWTQGGSTYTGPPLIELNGTSAGVSALGISILSDGNLIRGLVINRFGGDAIRLTNADSNTIAGCYIGTDPTGTIGLGNSGMGIRPIQSAGNLIGGTTAADRNLISANAFEGIQLLGTLATNNRIEGNFIGTDITGTVDLGNTHHGVELTTGPTGNVIEGNLISGNEDSGVAILAASNNTIIGNLIGTDITGTADIGNTDYGVVLGASQGSNIIGGVAAGEGNRIAFNLHGVLVSGSESTGNSIRGNSIFSNDGAGIELGEFGPTANDPDDPDTGGNQLQNFPIITSASSGSTRVTGNLDSTPNTTFALDFFSSAVTDPSNHGEGETYVGSISVTTDSAGDAPFSALFPQTATLGHFITATATDPAGNTSEFSAAVQVLAPTAAGVTIGGRVVNSSGSSVANSVVVLSDLQGVTREARANGLGYFSFHGVTVGAMYILSVRHKTLNSIPQTVFVLDARDDINLEVY